jgi:hypothetical protein
MTDNETEWLESIRGELAQSVATLDAETSSKLAQIRRKALARAGARKSVSYGLPVAALATAALILAILVTMPRPQPIQEEMIDDLDLITTSEDLDLFEDLEFYEWLEVYDLQG